MTTAAPDSPAADGEQRPTKIQPPLSGPLGHPPPLIRNAKRIAGPFVERRWKVLQRHTDVTVEDQQLLFGQGKGCECYARNIENFVGTAQLPIGVAGPLRVLGSSAVGDYYIPLATTEAALVASYHRGSQLITAAGGCNCALVSEGMERSPGFAFADLVDAGRFVAWATEHLDDFRQAAEATSRHLRFQGMYVRMDGNHVYLSFRYTTGDAAGQNMVTIATQAICDYVAATSPVQPLWYVVEANLSGDKKASALSFTGVRGKKVTAEVVLAEDLVAKYLHTTPRKMTETWRISAVGGVMSGTLGVQGHYANALAAIYIATGQDAACVSESAVGVTRMELINGNSLYASVTLPNVVVGSVGGGTRLPTQQACLRILRATGPGAARQLAEICAAVCLAGELSITGALASHEFTRAHQKLARGTRGVRRINGET